MRLAITAQKGGVGKTTTAIHLAVALVRRGLKVLLIDLDHQAYASEILQGQLLAENLAEGKGTAEVIFDGASLLDVFRATPSGVDLCAASEALEAADLELAGRPEPQHLLRKAIEAVPPGTWDVHVFDCPPSLGMLSVNALVAASHVLSPVMPNELSLRNIDRMERTIIQVQGQLNPQLERLGYLLCAVDEREPRLAQVCRQRLREAGKTVWPVEIRLDGQLKAAPSAAFRRRSRAVLDYEKAADKLLRRVPELRAAAKARRTS